ncbi:F-box protein PP2-B10-like [Nicotiana sylvestris]|uniref:F-box protein PP2-B10-like n=1 Tax=Nicotiana sylvestris TaxID=4096 RepID=A0A1U7UMN4_NICSY|nr:PREDICTED: F-box protein PP2-B10-like [Nicotiana sylvestris]XP_016439793.1 PREDICTED: F-box protein PP2-B10-like [Nicotiana tabacum]
MDYFSLLPEGCISEILSFTSPKDAATSSAISRGFKSAAESDVVWEKFLPSDYQHIISKSDSLLVSPSKKELYFSLCDSPILIDGGKLSFSLDKKTGKKCFMVAARELAITWGDTPQYWEWLPHPDSRFSEVAKLIWVSWLDIRGKIETRILSKKNKYAAYLVFKLANRFYGLETVNAYVRLVGCETKHEAEERASITSLSRREEPGKKRPKRRIDGWMEIEVGTFFNHIGEDGDVEARLMEIRHLGGKSGLVVQGMEFRPEEEEDEEEEEEEEDDDVAFWRHGRVVGQRTTNPFFPSSNPGA